MKTSHMFALPILAVSLLWSPVSVAQQPVLPRTSPSEQMVNEVNRSLRNLEIRQQQENRLQFEVNSLRAHQLRQQQFPRLTNPPPPQHCQPGAQGC